MSPDTWAPFAVFSRNSLSGEITFVEGHVEGVAGVEGIDGASSVAISPTGDHLYVAGTDDNAVALFSRNGTTGRLPFVRAFSDMAGPSGIAVSGDGALLYVSGWFDDSLVVFSRDADTGTIIFEQALVDDTGGVDGLYGAWAVVASPDDAHVYVAGEYDNGLGVFARDGASQQLNFVEIRQDRYEEADGLYGVIGVTVSPDGRNVYTAAGYDDNSIAVFARDTVTGALTFIEVFRDGENGVDGLYRASAVGVSPDGHYLYATGYGDDAVAVFGRDADTGALTFVEMQQDGMGGVGGDSTSTIRWQPLACSNYPAWTMVRSVVVVPMKAFLLI
jgi:6-phosphogluconolactonase (cycloisomerase 2 family)